MEEYDFIPTKHLMGKVASTIKKFLFNLPKIRRRDMC